jgi:sec-independent protein translocase protein TatB
MFDIGFSEIVVIGVVALLVFGPEELPRVARLAGHMLGKFRRYVDGVKSELSQEMEMAELKRLHEDVKDSARSIQSAVSEHLNAAENSVREVVSDVQHEAHTSTEDVPAEPALAAETPAGPDELPPFELVAPVIPVEEAASHVVADESQLDLFGAPIVKPAEDKVKADE